MQYENLKKDCSKILNDTDKLPCWRAVSSLDVALGKHKTVYRR